MLEMMTVQTSVLYKIKRTQMYNREPKHINSTLPFPEIMDCQDKLQTYFRAFFRNTYFLFISQFRRKCAFSHV